MSTTDDYVVQIVETATGEVSWASDPTSERSAMKIQRGASINLNHDRFHTVIVGGDREGAA